MKFWEAMAALEEGKKVRCKNWGPKAFWNFGSELKEMWITITDIYNMMQEEWELYEEPEKHMSFQEALIALKSGKKVKRKCWDKIIRKSKEYGIIFSSDIEPCIFCIEDFEAKDWIEVIE